MRLLSLTALTVALTLSVAGCSTSGTTSTVAPASSTAAAASTATVGNDADIMFLQMMIPHHQQAVDMANLVASRSTNPEVSRYAQGIAAAQQPEIDQMSEMLTSWGQPLTPGHGHGVMMEGILTEEQMSNLERASGAEFDQQWLTGMIAHHEGAVAMAKDVAANGSDPAVKALAEAIIAGQTSEIAEMQTTLQSITSGK